MSDENQLAAVRQKNILELINKNQSAKLNELLEHFGVSEATIRRDLAALEKKGVLARIHGGAVANQFVSQDWSNEQRAVSNVAEKSRIGEAATKLMSGDKTIFLDAGTTAVQIARELKSEPTCRFVTNSLGIANELRHKNAASLYLLGGAYLDINDSFTGSIAISAIRSLAFDIAFLCVSAIDVSRQNVSIGSEQYSQIQKEVIAVSRQCFVVADHTKFRSSAFVSTANFDQIDGVITTNLTDPHALEVMTSAGLEVIVA